MNTPHSREEIATAFLTLASSGGVQEAFERYIHKEKK